MKITTDHTGHVFLPFSFLPVGIIDESMPRFYRGSLREGHVPNNQDFIVREDAESPSRYIVLNFVANRLAEAARRISNHYQAPNAQDDEVGDIEGDFDPHPEVEADQEVEDDEEVEDAEEVEEVEVAEEEEEEDDDDHSFDPSAVGLKEISNLASFIVSSYKPGCGVKELRDDDVNQYWQYVLYLSIFYLCFFLLTFLDLGQMDPNPIVSTYTSSNAWRSEQSGFIWTTSLTKVTLLRKSRLQPAGAPILPFPSPPWN